MERQKRVATVHDISGFGRCSLTVALPIISAAGIEATVMPTALLSTHTGGLDGYSFLDLTGEMKKFADHWQSLGIGFDGIYSGYLGSDEQIGVVADFIGRFKRPETIVLIDPAMADNGKMYPSFSMDFAKSMAGLCAKADVIVPNITEACFMLGREFKDGPYTKDYIEDLLRALLALGPKKVVLTGVSFDDIELGAACLDGETGKISYYMSKRIEGYFHGTGDVYGSVLMSSLLCGKTLEQSIAEAVEFTHAAIMRTKEAGSDIRFGVNFEAGLGTLAQRLGNIH